jgi:hypothetical protein
MTRFDLLHAGLTLLAGFWQSRQQFRSSALSSWRSRYGRRGTKWPNRCARSARTSRRMVSGHLEEPGGAPAIGTLCLALAVISCHRTVAGLVGRLMARDKESQRLAIYVRSPVRAFLEERPGVPASRLLNGVVARHQEAVQASMPTLTEREWLAMADASGKSEPMDSALGASPLRAVTLARRSSG